MGVGDTQHDVLDLNVPDRGHPPVGRGAVPQDAQRRVGRQPGEREIRGIIDSGADPGEVGLRRVEPRDERACDARRLALGPGGHHGIQDGPDQRGGRPWGYRLEVHRQRVRGALVVRLRRRRILVVR
jgi:hypothetical protein